MAGSSRRVRRVNAITPSTISSRLITVANTGRLIERSEMFMRGQPRLRVAGVGRRPSGLRRRPRRPCCPARSLPVPSTTIRSPAFSPSSTSTMPVAARADLDVGPFDAAVGLDPVHERVAAHLHHRDLRHQQRLPLGPRQRDLQQHARAQRAVGVGEIAAHGHRARGLIDARIDGADERRRTARPGYAALVRAERAGPARRWRASPRAPGSRRTRARCRPASRSRCPA